MDRLSAPKEVDTIITWFQNAGYDAYIVGGCVRDSFLNIQPKDWDICTCATPTEIKRVFAKNGCKTIDTGLKHGTVTAILDGEPYEVTTFRVDGSYSDNRHPDDVVFVKNICQDLSRRDFTINAMASNSYRLIDPFHGQDDLKSKIIRCVGNPDDRFLEDSLRILRALRFASVYDFQIESRTAESIHKNRDCLTKVAAERVRTELCKLLCGKAALRILENFSDVISVVIPELKPCIGFAQNNRFHQYTVYGHIAHAVSNYNATDISIKMALLLHDIGKPFCYTEDENGGHFHGHAVLSYDIAKVVMDRLHFDNATKTAVLELVLYHDSLIEPTPKAVRRWLNKIGERRLFQLLDMKIADILAHANGTQEERINRCYAVGTVLSLIIEERQCFSLKDMAVNGNDIMSLGVPEGKKVGAVLAALLDEVISGNIPNERELLLNEAVRFI